MEGGRTGWLFDLAYKYLAKFDLNELMEVAGVEPDWRPFHRL